MVKSGLEFFILKFTEPLLRYLLGLPVHLSYIKKVQQQNLPHQKSPAAISPTAKKAQQQKG